MSKGVKAGLFIQPDQTAYSNEAASSDVRPSSAILWLIEGRLSGEVAGMCRSERIFCWTWAHGFKFIAIQKRIDSTP